MRIILVILFCAGCKDDRTCAQAVHKLFEITTMDPTGKGSKPGADEQKVIDTIETMTIGKCKEEGLSKAQTDCILAMKTREDMDTVGKCPAIAAKHPSWLLVPHAGDRPLQK